MSSSLILFLLIACGLCKMIVGQETFVVSIKDEMSPHFLERLKLQNGAVLKKMIGKGRVALVELTDEQTIEELKRWPMVLHIEKNHKYSKHYSNALHLQSVDLSLWNLDILSKQDFTSYNNLYEFNYTGNGVDVYVFDTGVKLNHQEFEGRASRFRSYTGSSCDDCDGHGTHVAGTVAGKTFGVSKSAQVMDVQVLGDEGLGDLGDIIEAIYDVADSLKKKSAAVMSLGGPSSFSMNQAVRFARQRGLYIAVSAGNDNFDACYSSPADSPDAITVAAHDRNGVRAVFSNYGKCLDVYAPGVSIKSAGINSVSSSKILSGTSMAAPHVAGIIAIMIEQNPNLSFFEIEDYLKTKVKNGFSEDDAPAVKSFVNVTPCPSFCQHAYVNLLPKTMDVLAPQTTLNITQDGNLKGWLFNNQNNNTSQLFRLSIKPTSTKINTEVGYPLVAESSVKAGSSYQFLVSHVNSGQQPGGNFSLFYEVPIKCSSSSTCNAKGNCDINSECQCFSSYYGDYCSESRTVLIFNYATTTGSLMFLALSLFQITSHLNCVKKNRVAEINSEFD